MLRHAPAGAVGHDRASQARGVAHWLLGIQPCRMLLYAVVWMAARGHRDTDWADSLVLRLRAQSRLQRSLVPHFVPIVALIATAINAPQLVDRFIHNPEIPLGLMIYGTCAQLVFLSRYAYQVVYSVKRHESCLPPVFWLISVVGASLTLVYGIIRHDFILMLGQSLSILIFSRNLWVGYRYSKNQ